MAYINEIFERMDLRQISSFLLDGASGADTSRQTYDERLEKGIGPIYRRLENVYKGQDELNKAVAELYKALNAYEEVYMELGMKAGFRLFNQLMYENGQVDPLNLKQN